MKHGNVPKSIADGLLVLRDRIRAAKIPPSKLDETLNIATWNIREFGKVARTAPAIHYIAEILNSFDVISVVELRDNLSDLTRVLDILGPYWRAVYSDMIPDAGGNHERIAFLYDKRAAVFCGFAATATAPRTKKAGEYLPETSWWRPPYCASFQAGDYDFVMISAHIRWGSSKDERTRELKLFGDWVAAKGEEKFAVDKDIIVTGDFNIENDEMYSALVGKGLKMPTSLIGKNLGSNLAKDKRYDQILLYTDYPNTFSSSGGILDFYAGDHAALFPGGMTKEKFTFQMSDHLPLWMQINTDIDDFKLDQISKSWKKG